MSKLTLEHYKLAAEMWESKAENLAASVRQVASERDYAHVLLENSEARVKELELQLSSETMRADAAEEEAEDLGYAAINAGEQ